MGYLADKRSDKMRDIHNFTSISVGILKKQETKNYIYTQNINVSLLKTSDSDTFKPFLIKL